MKKCRNIIFYFLLLIIQNSEAQTICLDSDFNPGMGATDIVLTSVIQTNQKILIGGYFSTYNDFSVNHIVRLEVDGSRDETFNTGAGANALIRSIAIQNDEKIVVGGAFTLFDGIPNYHIVRLHENGTIDTSFYAETDYSVYTIEIQPDGKILIGGTFTEVNGQLKNHLARLNADGSIDTTFLNDAWIDGPVWDFEIQDDNKIIIGGSFDSCNGEFANSIVRLHYDGTIDSTFHTGTGASNAIRSITIQPDGKIIIAGSFLSYNGIPQESIARLNSNGSFDWTFNVGSGANSTILTISLQEDGKVILGGYFTSVNGNAINRIARLNSNGSFDSSFSHNLGPNNTVYTTQILQNDKILIAGHFTSFEGFPINRVARLKFTGAQIEESDDNLNFQLFPNPFHEMLFIQNLNQDQLFELQIFDCNGRSVFFNKFNHATYINTSEFTKGYYCIRITFEGNTRVYKMLKE